MVPVKRFILGTNSILKLFSPFHEFGLSQDKLTRTKFVLLKLLGLKVLLKIEQTHCALASNALERCNDVVGGESFVFVIANLCICILYL